MIFAVFGRSIVLYSSSGDSIIGCGDILIYPLCETPSISAIMVTIDKIFGIVFQMAVEQNAC